MTDPAPPPSSPRHRSYVGPIILIVLGALFLIGNLSPGFDPWRLLWLFWPLILILIGLGKIWDIHYAHEHPGQTTRPPVSGTGVAGIIVLALFLTLAWHRSSVWDDPYGWSWSDRDGGAHIHDTQAVEVQGAKSVSADLEMPAGQLTLTGGSPRLLDADFDYERHEGKPVVDYDVSGDHGELSVKQRERHSFFGNNDNDWSLRFNDAVPTDLRVRMGAGQSNLQLNGMNLSALEVQMGAGELNLDLTGERKTSLQGEIQGGAGRATIRLPKDVGVRVNASGGIGAINASGFTHDGGAYVNDLYGKTSSAINLTIHGGVGEVDLVQE